MYQCDGCTWFCAISSAMFGSVLDNATLISWIASNRFRAVGLMEGSAENADSHSYVVGMKLVVSRPSSYWKNKLPVNFISHKIFSFRSVVLIFMEGASRSPENCLADPKRTAGSSLRTTGIDESMVLYRGLRSAKQFMKRKPVKSGYIMWMLCSLTVFRITWYILWKRFSENHPIRTICCIHHT